MNTLTWDRLTELLEYFPDTGIFTRKTSPCWTVKVGDIAGCIDSNRYHIICLDKRKYKAHQLAWLYCTKVWPIEELDHKNGIGSDNRISNLRPASHAENCRNRKFACTNTSGVRGVTWRAREKKWTAQIKFNQKPIHLGYFDTPEAASAAYEAKAAELFGEFRRNRPPGT